MEHTYNLPTTPKRALEIIHFDSVIFLEFVATASSGCYYNSQSQASTTCAMVGPCWTTDEALTQTCLKDNEKLLT